MRIRLLLTLALMAAIIYGQQHKPDFAKELRYPGIPTFQEYHPLPIEQSLERKVRVYEGATVSDKGIRFYCQIIVNNELKAGCVVIGENKVITVAHAIWGLSVSDFQIILGNRLLEGRHLTPLVINYYPGFDYFSAENYDICLIVFREFVSTENIINILPGSVETGHLGMVLGLGESDSYRLSAPSQLQAQAVRIYLHPKLPSFIHSRVVTGRGDDGSPLLVHGNNQRSGFYLAGLVAGLRFVDGGVQTVYIKLSAFKPWLDEQGITFRPWYATF